MDKPIVPQINHLEELDPTHIHWYEHPIDPQAQIDDEEGVEWPVFDDAKGG